MNHSISESEKAARYLLDRVQVGKADECWLWKLSTGSHGYGQLFWDHRVQTAHRFSYKLFKGDPGRLQVNHSCGNRRCCNPAHLYAGTQLQNYKDMLRHGTHVPPPHKVGSEIGNSKLTEADAIKIKQMLKNGIPGASIARQYSVSVSLISLIKREKLWKHVSK